MAVPSDPAIDLGANAGWKLSDRPRGEGAGGAGRSRNYRENGMRPGFAAALQTRTVARRPNRNGGRGDAPYADVRGRPDLCGRPARMKVGYLTASISRQAGGLKDSIRREAMGLRDGGAIVEVFAAEDSDSAADLNEWHSLPVILAPSFGP